MFIIKVHDKYLVARLLNLQLLDRILYLYLDGFLDRKLDNSWINSN